MDELLYTDENFIGDIIEFIREAGDELRENDSARTRADKTEISELFMDVATNLKEDLLNYMPESHIIENKVKDNVGYGWLADITESKTNFAYGYPYVIAVVLFDGRESKLSIVYDPKNDILLHATDGGGAYETTINGTVRLEMDDMVDDGVVLFTYPKNGSRDNVIYDHISLLTGKFEDIKSNGPVLLDIEQLVSGQAVLHMAPDLLEIEFFAGGLILKEAGGVYSSVNDINLAGTRAAVEKVLKLAKPSALYLIMSLLILIFAALGIFIIVLAVLPDNVFSLRQFINTLAERFLEFKLLNDIL